MDDERRQLQSSQAPTRSTVELSGGHPNGDGHGFNQDRGHDRIDTLRTLSSPKGPRLIHYLVLSTVSIPYSNTFSYNAQPPSSHNILSIPSLLLLLRSIRRLSILLLTLLLLRYSHNSISRRSLPPTCRDWETHASFPAEVRTPVERTAVVVELLVGP
jgi:hypothetical protein